MLPDTAAPSKLPDRRSLFTHREHRCRPRLAPAAFERPCAPAHVRRTGPRFPEPIVESPEPCAVQIRELLRAGLDPAKKLSELAFGDFQPCVAGRARGF